jgi:hypothetical protein
MKVPLQPSSLRPLCPVHGTLMTEIQPTPASVNEGVHEVGPMFKCHTDRCELFWARQHEHFEMWQGHPTYANADSSRRMRCLTREHGCLYLAAIHPTNLWTWKCSICDYSYTDAPGSWVNPPSWL